MHAAFEELKALRLSTVSGDEGLPTSQQVDSAVAAIKESLDEALVLLPRLMTGRQIEDVCGFDLRPASQKLGALRDTLLRVGELLTEYHEVPCP